MSYTTSEVKQKIITWLREEGLDGIEEDNLMNNKAINDFTINISKGATYLVHAVKPKNGNRIVIGRALILPELDQKAYSMLNDDTKRKFSIDLNRELIHLKVIRIFEPHKPEISIKTIRLMKPIYYDGLSKDRMFNCMNEVMSAYAFVMLRFREFNITSTEFDPNQYI